MSFDPESRWMRDDKVVGSLDETRGFVHSADIEFGLSNVPGVRALEGAEHDIVPDAITVRFVSGIEAGIEVGWDLDGLEDPDRRRQPPVESPERSPAIDRSVEGDAGDLSPRVHPGVGAAGPSHGHLGTRQLCACGFE